jgi:hypothetical protein
MVNYLYLTFASFETDHFSCGVSDCTVRQVVLHSWSLEGRELVTSGIQEQGIKKQMLRSIILVCNFF